MMIEVAMVVLLGVGLGIGFAAGRRKVRPGGSVPAPAPHPASPAGQSVPAPQAGPQAQTGGQQQTDQGLVQGTNHVPLSVSDCEKELVKRWGANWKDYLISEAKKFCWRSKNGLRAYLTAVDGLCNPRSDPRIRSMGITVVEDKEKVDRSEFFFEALYEAQNILSEAALVLATMDTAPQSSLSALEDRVNGLLNRMRPYIGPGLGAYLVHWNHGVYTPYYRQIADRLGIPVEGVSGQEGRRMWTEWLKGVRDAEYPSAPCVGR